MRWVVACSVAVPLLLWIALLIARLGGNQDLVRNGMRGLRILLAVEFILLLLCAAWGFAYEQRARKRDRELFNPPGRLIDVGGYRLHLDCRGSGSPTVILEHGHSATYLDWFRVQPGIAKHTRVCSYDRAGYGWSDPSPKGRTPGVMSEELHTLLHNAGEKPPYILVGHSFGAMNVLAFAHKFPGEVAGVVLVDGSHPNAAAGRSFGERMMLLGMEMSMPFGLPRWRGWCGGGPLETAAIKQALTCRPQYLETIYREDAAFAKAAREISEIKPLGNIPLVVIARDPATGSNVTAEARHSAAQKELTSLSSNSHLVIAEGSGHDIPLARPDVVVDAVQDLLKPPGPADSRGTP